MTKCALFLLPIKDKYQFGRRTKKEQLQSEKLMMREWKMLRRIHSLFNQVHRRAKMMFPSSVAPSVVRLGLDKYSAGLGLGRLGDSDETRQRLDKYEKKLNLMSWQAVKVSIIA